MQCPHWQWQPFFSLQTCFKKRGSNFGDAWIADTIFAPLFIYLQIQLDKKLCLDDVCIMYATYNLRANELNDDVVKTLKTIFQQNEIVILSKEAYTEIEKNLQNIKFTEKLEQGILDIEAGRGIVKNMAELEAM